MQMNIKFIFKHIVYTFKLDFSKIAFNSPSMFPFPLQSYNDSNMRPQVSPLSAYCLVDFGKTYVKPRYTSKDEARRSTSPAQMSDVQLTGDIPNLPQPSQEVSFIFCNHPFEGSCMFQTFQNILGRLWLISKE